MWFRNNKESAVMFVSPVRHERCRGCGGMFHADNMIEIPMWALADLAVMQGSASLGYVGRNESEWYCKDCSPLVPRRKLGGWEPSAKQQRKIDDPDALR
jgi:hypothetical protein